jgi:serine/threonine-protein kinase
MNSPNLADFRLQNPKDWKSLIDQLFPLSIPTHARWEGQSSIFTVLNHIGSIQNVNHLFFPDGGGLDLTSAKPANEEGLTELDFAGSIKLCKIANLTFESFGDIDDYQWCYFRIELESIDSVGASRPRNGRLIEELTEISLGHYVPRSAWDEREYQGEPLPRTARLISRILGGSMVIFQKSSIYNRIPGTYEAPHNGSSVNEMRGEIEKLRQVVNEKLFDRN